jgi:CheY-like chemotaxis protein
MTMSQILIVEDMPVARDALARLLSADGFSCECAANGRDAWAMLYRGLPQVIVLDLFMPQMDGLTFLKLLRNSDHWSHVPVIVMSGHTEDEKLIRRARALGVVDIIAKGGSAYGQLSGHLQQIVVKQPAPRAVSRPAARPSQLVTA